MIPFVGILIEPFTYRGIKGGDTGREHLPFYEKGGELYGLKPCYFRLSDIDFKSGEVIAYTVENEQFKKRRLPIPAVIHNRIMLKGPHDRERMRNLKQLGVHIFNDRNRFSKWYIHLLLEQKPSLKTYLPQTYEATTKTIKKMMKRHDQILIKPENGSIGKGILKLDRIGSKWELSYPIPNGEHGQKWETETFRFMLPSLLKARIRRNLYIVQERVPLACYGEAPFDMRVSVQRNNEGQWQVTGIVAKVASKGHFLTNVARGGRTFTLEQVISQHPTLDLSQVKNTVAQLAIEIAQYLGRRHKNLADLGLDIGITDDGKPYFIECNARDLRITFRNANMIKEWEETHTTPIGYAAYLTRRNLGI